MADGTGGRGKIVELMDRQADQWTISDLSAALQAAAELELSTLPPYLCGYWSIKDSSSEAATLIGSHTGIIPEEMLHLGLVCNMLVAIDGAPELVAYMPKYPGPLPGGVRPGLTVYLSGLTKEYVGDVFMGIEYPEGGPVEVDTTYPTIGDFYDAIATAFATLKPALSTERQLSQSVGTGQVVVLSTLEEVATAISEIKEQGEGTSQSPDAVDFGGELAHYYRFGEIFNGMHFVKGSDGKWGYTGPPPIPFPDAYPMAQVPAGGWSNAAPDVRAKLDAFNATFTSLLEDLEAAWKNGDSGKLGDAINTMFDLPGPAQELMQIPLPNPSDGNYGPEFLARP
jgi:ferritin-like protein